MKTTNNNQSKYNKSRNDKPWLNNDGSRKTDEEISELGKMWSVETWNRYLDATVDVGMLEDEEIIYSPYMDTLAEIKEQVSFQEVDFKPDSNLEQALLIALDELSRTQKCILKDFYWKDMTIEQIALRRETTPNSIRCIKYKALKRLRELIPSKKFQEKLAIRKMNKNSKLVSNETC